MRDRNGADLVTPDQELFLEQVAGDLANDPGVREAALSMSRSEFMEWLAPHKMAAAVVARLERNRELAAAFLDLLDRDPAAALKFLNSVAEGRT